MQMQVEVVAQRGAIKREENTEVTVLVRLKPQQATVIRERPSLNVGLVLDRSGSMAGSKLTAAKEAAQYAVSQLLARDRISVTIYDDEIETIVPSHPAENKEAIIRAIRRVSAGGSTALHDGWMEGATQVSRYLRADQLNRVILLTDGLANVGQTNPGRICEHVRALAARGVSTSALGLGRDFNEDLLQEMANAGDGNYQFIESARDLERIFAAEFQGLMATLGRKVSMGIEPSHGVKEGSVLNALERNEHHRLMLPNLVEGRPVDIVLTLNVPAQWGDVRKSEEREVCQFRIAWDMRDGKRQVVHVWLRLPVVSTEEWQALPENAEVNEAAALLEIGRLQEEAARDLEAGDYEAARAKTSKGRFAARLLSPIRAARENCKMSDIDDSIAQGDIAGATKGLKFDAYRKARSRDD